MLTANWICSYVLNDILAIHQNGTRTTSRKAIRPAMVKTRIHPTSVSLPQEVAADQRDARHEDGYQEDGDGHTASPPELVESHFVGIRREHLRGRAGPAARHHV